MFQWKKLKLTPSRCSGKHLSYFLFDLETLIDTVVENGKTPLFLVLDQI
jgi:23S rRNA (guanosine2251-2'-O)-methyltransferase